MGKLRDAVRHPMSTLTGLVGPPPPGSRRFAAWNRITRLNTTVYRATGGRVAGRMDGVPVLLLHHVGRSTGRHRVTPLLYGRDGDDLVVVASMGGTPEHPGWYRNLLASPDTEVEVGRERRPVRAHTASPEEKARLWPQMVAAYPAFATYQSRTERDIPVVVLRRR